MGNTLDGNPIVISNAPKVAQAPDKLPIAVSNPIGDGAASQVKFTPTPQTKKAPVHTIAAPENIDEFQGVRTRKTSRRKPPPFHELKN